MHNNSLDWIDQELSALDAQQLRRRLKIRQSAQAVESIELDGERLVSFSSNDYLALAGDRRIALAVKEVLDQTGWGSGSSPLITGRAGLHAQLEEELATFKGTEAALLFTSGFGANSATVAALTGKDDIIFSDEKNHASIIDGCRLSAAEVQIYPHCDLRFLAEKMRDSGRYRRRLLVTDSLFSMDGDIAPLKDLAKLAQQFDAMFMVDEAHATGVFGKHGRGIAETLNVEQAIDVRIGTLSKAFGSIGGFVAGSQSLIDYLTNRARAYVFSTALPEPVAAAALAALQIVRQEPQRRIDLLARAATLRNDLKDQGWNIGNTCSQIIPLVVGDPTSAIELSAALRRRGMLVPCIRPPTVAHGESMLRVSLSYGHSQPMIDGLVDALHDLRS